MSGTSVPKNRPAKTLRSFKPRELTGQVRSTPMVQGRVKMRYAIIKTS